MRRGAQRTLGRATGRGSSRAAALGVTAALCFAVLPASAEVPLVETEPFQLRFSSYTSNFSLYSRLGYDTGGLIPEQVGTNAALLRLEWNAQFFDDVTLQVHNRFFWMSATEPDTAALGLGLGSTLPPARSLDLSSTLVEAPGLELTHDLDRLLVTTFTPAGDFTLGRQAITWGVSYLFTVADLWTQFSPFELDTSQKRGVDAARALLYPGEGMELDLVVADRGGLDEGDASDLSGGARMSFTAGTGDYYAGAAKSYDRVLVLAGSAVDFEVITARLEATLAYALDDDGVIPPRVTAGVDYFAEQVSLVGEYHFNGPGTANPDAYVDELILDPDPEVTRGERYFVGQHYAGVSGTYMPWVELQLGSAVLLNVLDPSAMIVPSVIYEFSPDVRGALGAYLGVGETPTFDPAAPADTLVPSEFGLVGQAYYLQLSGFI